MGGSDVRVNVHQLAGGGQWSWTSRPGDGRAAAEHSPVSYGSALAAITAAQGHFGPGGVTIIV